MTRVVRIVIVDDEPPIVRALQAQLRLLGHQQCPAAHSEPEALKLIESTQPDLVIMDVSLGAGGDGTRLALEIRKRWGIPSLFLTAHADDDTLTRCKAADPAGYLLKPFSLQLLRITLEMALHREFALRERAVAEAERRHAESRFVAILENAPIAIFATLADRVVLFNQAAVTLFDRTAERLEGSQLADLLEVQSTPSTDSPQSGTHSFHATGRLESGGEIPVLVRSVFIEHHGERLTTYFVQDLRERLALERQLGQAQRSHAVSTLASGVAHDFNNLLGALQTLLFLIETESTKAAGPQLKDLERAIERGSWLTQQLVQLGRHADRGAEILDLGHYLVSMEPLFRRLLAREVQLEVTGSLEPTPVRVSTAQLQHLVLSIMLNAQDAMPEGGKLQMAVRRTQEFVELAISDSGRGMSPDILSHAMDPYFTTKPAGSGTGLGLPTVRRTMEALGGRVELESIQNLGTSVRLYFPMVRSTSESPPVTS